jgi:hypothetical protein
LFWAKAELVKQNALIRQGTITIIGRPELKLGYPVYVPSRDAFYYVKGIENRFTFGGTFTTTLTLCAERAKTDTKLGLFVNVGELKDGQVATLGTTISEPNGTNNFVKQLAMKSVCTPRAKEHVDVVEPNFTIDLTKISSDVLSEWRLDHDAHVDPSTGTEYSARQFQTSDKDGYEIIGQITSSDPDTGPPFVSYGYFDKLKSDGTADKSAKTSSSAMKALVLDIKTNNLEIDPNNAGLTLDSIGVQLVDYGSRTSAPNKARDMDVSTSQDKLNQKKKKTK